MIEQTLNIKPGQKIVCGIAQNGLVCSLATRENSGVFLKDFGALPARISLGNGVELKFLNTKIFEITKNTVI